MSYYKTIGQELVGKTLSEIKVDDDDARIYFTTTTGEKYLMYHRQDCCESVSIEDIAGDINWLVGEPILTAEERSNSGDGEYGDSCTWTFYEFATIKGSVTIRWYGASNGYYSEGVDFERIEDAQI